MNYPQPEILSKAVESPKTVIYLYVPEYRFEINNICDALDKAESGVFDDDELFSADDGPIGILREHRIFVRNTTNRRLPVTLFGSVENRLAANFGNPAGIVISTDEGTIPYSELLAMTEHRAFHVVRAILESEQPGTLNNVNLVEIGPLGERPPIPFRGNTRVVVINREFLINYGLKIIFDLSAHTTLLFCFTTKERQSGFLQNIASARHERQQARQEMKAARAEAKMQKAQAKKALAARRKK